MTPPPDRIGDWLRTACGGGLIALPLLAQQWYAADWQGRVQDRRTVEINELRALTGLGGPEARDPVVRAADLARLYRDDPRAADRVYGGRRVTVPLRQWVARGTEAHWHLGDPARPAVVVLEFAAPPPAARPGTVLWVTGTVAGAVPDDGGPAREIAGYNFHVRLTECRPD